VLNQDDLLLASSTDKAALEQAVSLLENSNRDIATTARTWTISGFRLETHCSSRPSATQSAAGRGLFIVQIRRGDSDMLPRPDLLLEVGDRVGVFVHRSGSRLFALSSATHKGTTDFSYISMGIGAALGLLVGMILCRSPV